MSVDKPRHRNTLWDISIESAKSVSPIAADLAGFEQDKNTILKTLRKVHSCGDNLRPFDEIGTWRDLSFLAKSYFRRPIEQQETMLRGRRVKRLKQLADASRKACCLIEAAMRDDVGDDLFRGWCAESNLDAEGPSDLIRSADEIEEAAAGLKALEAAARRAAVDVPKGPGAPKGAGILPPDYITALERVYLRSTGLELADTELFTVFVQDFLNAIRHGDDVSANYDVAEAVKYARKCRALHQAGKKPRK